MAREQPVVIIGGPTASGKSALALSLAETFGGIVINADSMQVYRELKILTVQPGPKEQARAPHRLYAIMPASTPCSAAMWRGLAIREIERAWPAGRLPILVGGTGLYLRALLSGLTPLPPIPAEVRARGRALYRELGGPAFHAMLAERDPEMAARVHPGDRQRSVRAFEVIEATGRSLAVWRRAASPAAALEGRFAALVLDPPREALYRSCDARFEAMVARGALEEAAALDRMGLDPELPAMKVVGLRALLSHLKGERALGEAVAEGQKATRRYAKRQVTWFRHQMPQAKQIRSRFSGEAVAESTEFIQQFLLTPGS